jgi:hypothetical protein
MNRRTAMALAWVLMAGLLVTVGCESSSSSDGGGGEIVAKSVKEDLRVGIEESVLNIAERGAGTLRAEVSWADSRRIRAYFTVSGPGNILIDRTQSDSPLTIETAVEAGNAHILYIGNPDGPDVVDVDYTVFFEPAN